MLGMFPPSTSSKVLAERVRKVSLLRESSPIFSFSSSVFILLIFVPFLVGRPS